MMAWYDSLVDGVAGLGDSIGDAYDDVVDSYFDFSVDNVQSAAEQKAQDYSASTKAAAIRSPHGEAAPVYADPVNTWTKAGVVVGVAGVGLALYKLVK